MKKINLDLALGGPVLVLGICLLLLLGIDHAFYNYTVGGGLENGSLMAAGVAVMFLLLSNVALLVLAWNSLVDLRGRWQRICLDRAAAAQQAAQTAPTPKVKLPE